MRSTAAIFSPLAAKAGWRGFRIGRRAPNRRGSRERLLARLAPATVSAPVALRAGSRDSPPWAPRFPASWGNSRGRRALAWRSPTTSQLSISGTAAAVRSEGGQHRMCIPPIHLRSSLRADAATISETSGLLDGEKISAAAAPGPSISLRRIVRWMRRGPPSSG